MVDEITKSIIVKGEIGQIYAVWKDFANFPRFMKNIESVTPRGDGFSHWVMRGPLDIRFEWDAKTTLLEENSRIAWKSIDGDMKTSGQVTFKALPHNETQITVTMHYVPPAGAVGEVAAALFSQPEQRVAEDLQNFKAYVEVMDERLPTRS
jgi:uncharacterized membrane protein